MPTTIVAQEQPLSRIFSNDYVFSIPPYQRPYAWTTEQAGELLDDLLSFMRTSPGAVEDMPPYFLGSIVLIKAKDLPNAEVVDGQQRLTTLVVLLSVIRTVVGEKDATDITQLIYEKGSQILGTQDRFRLSLRERDRDFFRDFIQREDGLEKLTASTAPLSDARENLRKNARLFLERVQTMPEDRRLRLAQFVVTRCFLVAVATPDLDSAYRIFSVLNSRGLDLSATDILKAGILGDIPEKLRIQYTEKWEDCEEDLGRESFAELFSHIRMIYRKAKPQGTLLKEFDEHVLKQSTGAAFLDNILLPIAEVYEQITDAGYSSTHDAQQVNERLKWLNRLEFTDWIPPALAFAVRNRNKPAEILNFFADLERLAYSMLIRRFGINERIERFSRITRAIEASSDLNADDSPLQLGTLEQHDVYAKLDGPIYESLSARARSTILLRLDSLLSAGGASYDYETITVEHVMPQSTPAGSAWVDWFPDAATRADWVHRLGNLALLTRKKNSAASNYDFDRKKTAYFTRDGISPFVLTTQVLRHSSWSHEVVSRRQEELTGILEQHWRLERRTAVPGAAP